MDFKTLNDLRSGAILMGKVAGILRSGAHARQAIKKDRPVTDEVLIEVKPREAFPSRQTYRAHIRAWAKQQVRFVNAYNRGDLAPHLHHVVQENY
jgi:hypothetical protein